MKKIIIAIAIIMIAVLAFGVFNIGFDKVLPDSSETVSGSESTGTLNPDTSTSTKPSVSTDVVAYLYTIEVYKQGTTTLISDFDVESNSETATLSYSGNTLTFKSADAEYTVSYTSIKTIDSISVTRVTPGTTSVYITYTPTSSETTHTHSYTVTKAATCTASGVETCTCGATQTIAATGHSYSVTKAATCTTSGVETCTSCGVTQTIAAFGHTCASPTCANSNLCTRCNEYYYIDHTWGDEEVVFIEPTCTEPGTEGYVCIVCGVEDRSGYLYPTGHSYTVTRVATCTTSGVKTCTSCGATQTIAATGHSYTVTKSATCTTTGVETCASCGATQTIAMKAHDFSDGTAGCGIGHYYSCVICGKVSNISIPHVGDSNGDGLCDYCRSDLFTGA